MKLFKTIPTNNEKSWREQKIKTCSECRKNINEKEDYFALHCFWKIKRNVDKFFFCSFNCLRKWSKKR